MPDKARSQPALRNVSAVHFELHSIHEHEKDHAGRPSKQEKVRPKQRALGLRRDKNTRENAMPLNQQRVWSNRDRNRVDSQRWSGNTTTLCACQARHCDQSKSTNLGSDIALIASVGNGNAQQCQNVRFVFFNAVQFGRSLQNGKKKKQE
jgi:hypothetical protein